MDKHSVDYTLYLCTDRKLMRAATIEESVERAIDGGVTIVQLREKNISSLEFYQLALRVKAITHRAAIPLIINDRVDIALAVDADGVHVGTSDLPAAIVRRMTGEKKLVGVSVHTHEQAMQAVQDGADYLGVGAMYATSTKTDAMIVTIDALKKIRAAVSIPVVVIGGINKTTIPAFRGLGINGAAVISAVLAADDATKAARELITLWQEQSK